MLSTEDVRSLLYAVGSEIERPGVLWNTHQVLGNVPNIWEMLHCQYFSIYSCIHISIEWLMLEKLCIALRPNLLISKLRIVVLPSASAKAVRYSENRIGFGSQDARVSSKNH